MPSFDGDYTLGIHKILRHALDHTSHSTFIFVVSKGDFISPNKNGRHDVPTQFVSYANPLGYSFIFLRDNPEDITTAGRFFIHHEIGHSSIIAKTVETRFYVQNFCPLGFIVWSVFNVQFNLTSCLLLTVMIFTYLSLRNRVETFAADSRLFDEIAADGFAIATMPEADRGKLRNLNDSQKFTNDPTLTVEQNIVRKRYFDANLANFTSGSNTKKIHEVAIPFKPIESFTFVIAVVLLSSHAREFTTIICFINVMLFLFCIFALKSFQVSMKMHLSLVVKTLLSRHPVESHD